MKPLQFPIIRLTVFLVVGIIIAQFVMVPIMYIIPSVGVLLLLLSLIFVFEKKRFKKSIWFDAVTYLLVLSIGVLAVNVNNERLRDDHYSRIDLQGKSAFATVKIKEVLKPSGNQDKFVGSILKIDNTSSSGTLIINIRRDFPQLPLQVDDVLLLPVRLSEIPVPLNPYQFNYRNYLKRRYIDHQVFVLPNEVLTLESRVNTILGHTAKIRNKIDAQLKVYQFTKEQQSIIDALLLGQKKDISQQTYNSYVDAGVIHILAVSGLHVGIILLMLNRLFKFMERFRYGRLVKICFIVFLMWCFAALAGFSPSVTRAVSMFTVIAIAMNLKKPTNIYNTLAISMFVILLIKPMFLFEVGFQMSYAAVLSIVSLKPVIASFWSPKRKLANYYWQLLCVTLAAQIGVAPISLYYFHQFPALFFLSNLVILPFLGFILGCGILVIILAFFDILPSVFAKSYGLVIDLMNGFVYWVSQHEGFVFRNVSFGIALLLGSYLLIIAVFRLLDKQNFSRLLVVLGSVMVLQGVFIATKYVDRHNEFIVFHKGKGSLLATKRGGALFVGDNLDSHSKRNDRAIRGYKIGMGIDSIEDVALESVYTFDGKRLLVVDSFSVYNTKTFKPDFVLLRDSPKVNLRRLIDSLNPKLVIADGSNYRTYVQRWKETCDLQDTPFHFTGTDGAFRYRYAD